MAEMNRRTMLKVACAIPIVGGFSKLLATEIQEYPEFWNPRIHPNSQANLHELKRNLKSHIKELRKIPQQVNI